MKNFVFDIDGVLVKGFHYNPAFRKNWCENLVRDLGIDGKIFAATFFLDSLWQEIVTGRIPLDKPLAARLAALGYQEPVEKFIQYWFENDADLDHQLLTIVKTLRHIPETRLFIATNQEQNRADYLWNTLELKSYFEDIFYSGALGVTKDDPEFFCTCRRLMNVDDSILFFDDTPSSIEAATIAGWNAVQYETIDTVLSHPAIKALGI